MKLSAKQSELAALLINSKGDEITSRKLSDFYQSRTTNYAKCLDAYPFQIIRDTDTIVSMGFNKAVKAVVTLTDCEELQPIKEKKALDHQRFQEWMSKRAK